MSAALILRFSLVVLAPFAATLPALAQDYSYTTWSIAGNDVTLRVTLPQATVRPLVGDGIQAFTNAALARYVATHVDVHAGLDACSPIDQGQDVGTINTLAPQPGRHRYEIIFRCPHSGPLRLDSHLLFAQQPNHIEFASVQRPDGTAATRLLDTTHQSLPVPADRLAVGDPLSRYVNVGLSDLLGTGARLAFLLALLLGLHRRDDRITAAAGLAAGYALSVALAAGGALAARPEAAEPTIGLLTLLLATRAAGVHTAPRWLGPIALTAVVLILSLAAFLAGRSQAALLLLGAASVTPCLLLPNGTARPAQWLIPTVLFGLLDGASFADGVAAISLPTGERILVLLGHHAGALLGAALVCGVVSTGAWLVRRWHWLSDRQLFTDLTATALAGFGAFWFVSRLYE